MSDYCAVLLCNSSPNPMTLVDHGQEHGQWTQGPDTTIGPNEFGYLMLTSTSSVYGPDGFVIYKVTGSNGATGQIKFFFSCPYSGNNVLDWVWVVKPTPQSLTAIYAGRAGDASWVNGSIQTDGSPVTGIYFVIN